MFTAEQKEELELESKSQLGQDMFVLSELDFKRGGYFVEFGATDGVELSNTYLLEKRLGWTGILAEPAVSWHIALPKNRNCHIDFNCVWSKSGEILEFNNALAAELSTIDTFSSCDEHAQAREDGLRYTVPTISLNDLLEKYKAPTEIDYLSIDTEGSEFEILSAFDFDKHKIKVITCEHNYTPMRGQILQLLQSKGYVRKYTEYSRFDDWYVLL